MKNEKSAFPILEGWTNGDGTFSFSREQPGITQDYYAAVRIFPKMLGLYEYARTQELSWEETFEHAAELTWQAVDALNKAKEARDGKDNG